MNVPTHIQPSLLTEQMCLSRSCQSDRYHLSMRRCSFLKCLSKVKQAVTYMRGVHVTVTEKLDETLKAPVGDVKQSRAGDSELGQRPALRH